ncbi:MAG: MFS transporter, partial [Armatimonadetes bacterium]|nr:MFS transporter [Armatimonadota bacterium]
YIADITTPENRARGMGMIGAAFGLGFVFGPALAGVLCHLALENSWRPQFVVGVAAAAFSTLDLALAGARLPESLTEELRSRARAPGSRLQRMAAALRTPGLGLPILLFFLSTIAWSTLEPTLGLASKDRFEFTEAQTGYLFGYLGLIVALVQGGLTGRLVRRSGEARMALAGSLLLTVGLALLPLARHWGPLLGLLALVAVGQALLMPGLQSLISRAAAQDEQGATLGVSQGFSSLARVIGPATGGALYGIGQDYPFWFSAALLAGAFALATRLRQ